MSNDYVPYQNIQNHINWCWVVTTKIVGIEYCQRNHIPTHSLANVRCKGIIRTDHQGLRSTVCGLYQGKMTVDALQYDIVEHAKDLLRNPDGNLPEDDEAKARALRYIVTGDPYNLSLNIVVAGLYSNTQDLLSTSTAFIDEAIGLGNPFIGNYLLEDGNYHSVALFPVSKFQLDLYDPWDGFKERFSKLQIFKSGFLTNQGKGIIKWIQYIRP